MVRWKVEDAYFNNIYPVGSIYMSVNDTNPSELFGGEWEQIEDKFLLACGTNHINGTIGGTETVSLTEQEMPRHTHIQNQHRHELNRPFSDNSGGSASAYVQTSNRVTSTKYTTYTTATNQYTGGTNTTQAKQNGKAHNNMPPYLAVYVWVRTK